VVDWKKQKKNPLSQPLIGPSNLPLDLTMTAPLYYALIGRCLVTTQLLNVKPINLHALYLFHPSLIKTLVEYMSRYPFKFSYLYVSLLGGERSCVIN
jgi:hypothetical protein